MMTWSWFDVLVMLIYFLLLMYLGYFFSQKRNSSNDYFVGGKKIPSWVAALSVYATALSSISYVAITSNVYKGGWIFGMASLGVIPLLFLVAHFFIPFIRRIHAITAYQYIEARFDRSMRLMASAIFMVFHVMRIAIVLFIPTLALITVWPTINPYLVVGVMGFLCVIYTTIGGFHAVVWSDAIQTIVLVFGAILVIFFGFQAVPKDINPFLVLALDQKIFPDTAFSFDPEDSSLWWLLIGGFFVSIYQYIGSQDITQRYSSTNSLSEAKKTLYMQIPLLFTSMFIFIGMGSAIYLFYKFSGVPSPELSNNNALLPYFVVNQLPVGVSGIVISAIFAATQSTVSSSLNSTATCAIIDFILPMKKLSESQKIYFAQVVSWFAGISGVLIAMSFISAGQSDMYLFFNAILGLLGGPIAGVFLLGIFSTKVSSQGAWLGFLISASVAIYLANPADVLNYFTFYQKPQIFEFLFAPVVLISCLVPGYFSTFFFKPPTLQKIEGLTFKSLSNTSDIE
ncbi:MAG: sodium:solute symporter [Brevinema sp.]